eukprot:2090697-Lingulodinium_polyedra.AAC.1
MLFRIRPIIYTQFESAVCDANESSKTAHVPVDLPFPGGSSSYGPRGGWFRTASKESQTNQQVRHLEGFVHAMARGPTYVGQQRQCVA